MAFSSAGLSPSARAFPSACCASEGLSIECVDDPCPDGSPEVSVGKKRVHPFSNEHGVRKCIGVGRWVGPQTLLIFGRQTEAKTATEFVQQSIDFAFGERAETHPPIVTSLV